jgi:type IV pilus assembly protein PilW
MFNLDGSAGTASPTSTLTSDSWKRYRYRVYETVVPMRNMIWGATS